MSKENDLYDSICIGDHILTPDLREKTFEKFRSLGGEEYYRLVVEKGQEQANITFKLTEECFSHRTKVIDEHLKNIWKQLKGMGLDNDGNNEIDAFEFCRFCTKCALDERLTVYEQNPHNIDINEEGQFADTFHKLRMAFAVNYNKILDGLEKVVGDVI